MPEVKDQKVTIWYDWKTTEQVDKDNIPIDAVKDTRSGYYSVGDSQTLESYVRYLNVFLGYLDYVKRAGSKIWKRPVAGPTYMRDLGFVPVTAMPSYWDADKVKDVLAQFQNSATHIPVYPRPYLGTTDTRYENKLVGTLPDWWVSKLDVSRVTGRPVHQIGVKEVFEACGVTIR